MSLVSAGLKIRTQQTVQSVPVGAVIIKKDRSLIVSDEYPGDIFFVSTRLLLWLPRDL